MILVYKEIMFHNKLREHHQGQQFDRKQVNNKLFSVQRQSKINVAGIKQKGENTIINKKKKTAKFIQNHKVAIRSIN